MSFSFISVEYEPKQLMNDKFLMMSGFEPRTSGVGGDRSTNCAIVPFAAFTHVTFDDAIQELKICVDYLTHKTVVLQFFEVLRHFWLLKATRVSLASRAGFDSSPKSFSAAINFEYTCSQVKIS